MSRPPLPDPLVLAPRVAEKAREAAAGLEFSTFLLGVRARRLGRVVPEAALEAWKGHVKREAGGLLAAEWEGQGRSVAWVRPELLLVWDQDRERVEATVRPVFLYGRYVKLTRALPQTRASWSCPGCRGKRPRGCDACQGTGRLYPVALEDLLAGACARAFDGPERESLLHGMGREDVDVQCLGAGRPFVVEVRAPRRRATDVAALAAEIEASAQGRVELPVGLRLVGDLVARVKEWRAQKVYRAVARAQGRLDPDRVAALPALLGGATLSQRTPQRVARSRTDLVRARRVLEVQVLSTTPGDDGDRVELRIEAEAGTYIKELVSSDAGRTEPSVSTLLGVPCTCEELDVLEVRATDEDVLSDRPPPATQAGDDED